MSAPPIELVIWKPSVDEEKIPVPRHIAATCGSELATKPRRLAAESPPMERKGKERKGKERERTSGTEERGEEGERLGARARTRARARARARASARARERARERERER